MIESEAVEAFAALAQETRLRILRLVVAAGEGGMAAGAIGEAAGASASNTSFHLAHLERAGLVESRRAARSIIYSARLDGIGALVRFLVADCCGGHPELCRPLIDVLPKPPRPFEVLFLCSANSARSIMAESILRQDGAGRFLAHSAGSRPKGAVDPLALEVLADFGYPTDGLDSKSWSVFAEPNAPALDFVFTVCDAAAGEACPAWPGEPVTAHWGIGDPAKAGGDDAARKRAYVQAFGYLRNRIAVFVELPFATLERRALATTLSGIGRLEGASAGSVIPLMRQGA